jgi:glycosyltransferase involved in cell wall biosynthesis
VNLRGDWWREYFDYRTQLNPLHKLASLYYFFFWSTGIEFSDFIIPICKWLEKIVNDRLPSIPTSVIYQGVDVDPWVTDRNGDLGLKKPAVGILQDHNVRLKVRGLLWFSNVIRKMSDVNFHIAGGGPYTQKVEEALGNFKNVHLMGRLPYPDGVRKFHRSCDLYVLPSGLDCCPTTLLEASLCGKAVIASRIGGIPELVVENETGWTLPNENPADWIDKIRLLINDGRLARKMGDQGRKFVAENFSWRRVSLAVVDIMRKVLG